MPIALTCPRCSSDVSVPDELSGGYAFCSKCNGRVWVPSGPRGKSPPATASAPVTTPGSSASESESRQEARGNRGVEPIQPPAQPPPRTPPLPPGNAPSPGNVPLPRAKVPAVSADATGTVAAAPPPSLAPGQRPGASQRRVAKVITSDAAASRLQIGSEGELPRLKLDAEADHGKRKRIKSPTAQWQWVVLATVSFTVCALTLMMDSTTTGRRVSAEKNNARARIKRMYLGAEGQSLEEYQLFLRYAQLAYARRDFKTEKKNYRDVLRLLRSEHLNPHYDRTLDDPNNKGVTGQRCKSVNDDSKPSDEDLEYQLLILLGDS
jgi:hypothetical protein